MWPQVDFAPAEIYADPGVPSSPRWHVAPSQPPRGVFPGPAVGGAAAQDAQALGKPARPPPAARRRGEQAQSGFLALGRCPLLAGFEAFFFLVTCLALHCVRLGD